MTRYSKSAVSYTDDHGSSNEQCSKCHWYENPTTCTVVVGRIRPEGWCEKYIARADGGTAADPKVAA